MPPEKGFLLTLAVFISPTSAEGEVRQAGEGTAERRAVKLHPDLFPDAAGILSRVYSCALLLTPQSVGTDVKCGSVKFLSAQGMGTAKPALSSHALICISRALAERWALCCAQQCRH